MTLHHHLLTIITAIVAVQLCRHLPFWVFPAHKPIPKFVQYLGRVLPPAVFGLLVVYCYKNANVFIAPNGLPEFIAGITVIILHWWQRNMFLSIGVGTVLYMVLVQRVFLL